MTDTPRIDGIPDPRKSAQLNSDDPIDAEKFKRMLKVEESDEAQKQHKRRKPKKQEEEEEFEKTEVDQNIPKDVAFNSFFGESKEKENLFAVKGGTKVTQEASNLDGLSLSPLELSAKDKKKKQDLITPFLNFEEALPKAFSVSTRHNASLKTPFLEESKIEDPSIINPSATPLAPLANTVITEEDDAKLSSLEAETILFNEHRQDKQNEEKEEPTQLITPPPLVSPPLLTTETPAYANLSSHVFELFEKMIGLLMIQEYKGISITTIKLSMPGSVFNDCEIKIEHYDTAPHAFNLQLLGNPEAIELFNANYDGLVNSFKGGKYSFQANIRRPILADTYRTLTKKRSSKNENDQNSQIEDAV